MFELRRPSLRLAAGLAIAVVALVQVQTLVHGFETHARLRDRAARTISEAIDAARPRLSPLLAPGGQAAFSAAIHEALVATLAAEVEVFDLNGRLLQSAPSAPSPIRHWPSAPDLARLGAGAIVTAGPFLGEASRQLTYVRFPSQPESVIVRFSTPVPDVVDDLRERRWLLVGHAVSLAILVFAGAFALFPGALSAAGTSQGGALKAYETAMERLHERSAKDQVQLQRVEEELRNTAALARSAELAAGIAHEMRNGLGTILGYARLVERGSGDDAREATRSIRAECEALDATIRRFMEFAQHETLRLARVDVGRMLARVVAREVPSALGLEPTLEVHEVGEVVADEELLERAFENLLRNAREAAGTGGHVWVTGRREGNVVVVSVSDDGPGLPPELRERFRPFATTKPGGLGLGLPLAVKIVQLHEGELSLSQRMPRGVTASVRLPVDGPPNPDSSAT